MFLSLASRALLLPRRFHSSTANCRASQMHVSSAPSLPRAATRGCFLFVRHLFPPLTQPAYDRANGHRTTRVLCRYASCATCNVPAVWEDETRLQICLLPTLIFIRMPHHNMSFQSKIPLVTGMLRLYPQELENLQLPNDVSGQVSRVGK